MDSKDDAVEWKHLAAGMTDGNLLVIATDTELVIAQRRRQGKHGYQMLKIPVGVLHQAGLRIADANLQVELLEANNDMEKMGDSIQDGARTILALRTRIQELEKELRDAKRQSTQDSPGGTSPGS